MNHYAISESDRQELIAALESTGRHNCLAYGVKSLQPVAQAAQPAHALNWSELVAWWESGAEQWEGLRDIVSRMVARARQPAHAHTIDTSPEGVEKQAGDVQVPEGWKLVPIKPSAEQLHSMAVRYDHGLGMDGYYDGVWVQQTGVTHAMKLDSTKRTMNQLYEEAIGEGFYKIPAAPSTKEQSNGDND